MHKHLTKIIRLHGAKLAEELDQFSRDGYELLSVTPIADGDGGTDALLVIVRKADSGPEAGATPG